MAPRREPALMMVRHIESHTSMNESGPEASAPTPFTGAPLGRKVEKSCPMPPPCCMVSAASFTFSKIDAMSSSIVPMTKQLKSVTVRPVPAPAITRPAGRNLKPDSACSKRPAQSSGSFSGTAKARATRFHVASRSVSEAPEVSRNRYFMSQMRWETGAHSIPKNRPRDDRYQQFVLILFLAHQPRRGALDPLPQRGHEGLPSETGRDGRQHLD